METITKEQLDAVYNERNRLVAALSKCLPSHLQKHDESDECWEKDWLNIVCIHIPTHKKMIHGEAAYSHQQVTWHIHDSDLPMFSHLNLENNHWDGHDTKEKYDRLERMELNPNLS